MKYPLRSQSLKDSRKLARGEIYRLRLADSPHLRSQISEETYNQIVSGEYVTRIGDVLYKNVKCPKCAGSFTSGLEDRLVDALQKRGVQVVRNCRSIISSPSGRGLEIDLYLPQYRVGVEVNGLYFHSEQYMDSHRTHLSGKEYHKAKTDLCELVGVQLLHLW